MSDDDLNEKELKKFRKKAIKQIKKYEKKGRLPKDSVKVIKSILNQLVGPYYE